MIDYFLNPIIAGGSGIMSLILLCSFLMWWLFIDSLLKIWIEKKALVALKEKNVENASQLKKSLFYPLILEYATKKKSNANDEQLLQKLSKGLDLILPKLERRLNFAGTVVQIAPLLGLLGTVSGMIMTFEALRNQSVTSGMLSAGISKALFTTEFGLLVAIPGVLLGFLLNRYVTRLHEEYREWLVNVNS